MQPRIHAVVVGAGVIGLAIARALALRGRDVVVIEAEPTIGLHQSSRNSGVIHAGLYYPPGSLKARTCVAGRDLLYAYCRERSIAHRRLGKLVVAARDAELERLVALRDNAVACGVDDLAWLEGPEVARVEPAVRCLAALSSPSTGIVDVDAYMRALWADAHDRGATLALRTRVERVHKGGRGFVVRAGDDEIACDTVVVAAGVGGHAIARAIEGLAPGMVPSLHPCKGSYFALRGPSPFSRLVYPLHVGAHLGVHVTLDLAGRARFGPDQEFVDAPDLAVDPARNHAFADAIRPWWPDVDADRLVPDFAGVRAKIHAPGEPPPDFLVLGPDRHDLPGLVVLFGIESPGLTASLALADHVVDLLER